jgi:hypothetical protein
LTWIFSPWLKNEEKAEKVHALSLYDRPPLVLSREREKTDGRKKCPSATWEDSHGVTV